MNRVSRELLRGASAVAAAWAIGVGGLGSACSADVIQFDPDGAGGANGAVSITSLDWAPGNALAKGGNQAVANFLSGSGSTDFELDYQATLFGYIDQNNLGIQPTGLNTNFQITVVAKFFETVSNVTTQTINGVTSATATFAQAADQTGGFFEIWYDTNVDANGLAGTGFRDGTKILSATVTAVSGNFTVTDVNASPVDFDQTGTNNYPGLKSVVGTGSPQVNFSVGATDFDPSFFLSAIKSVAFDTTSSLPFNKTDPSQQFFGYNPDLGTVNGSTTSAGGPDIQFQADGSASFAVPEPASVVLVTLGVFGVVGLDWKRRRGVRTA